METTIYYFTGTGNSLKIAKDLAQQLKGAEIVQISKNNIGGINVTSQKVGIVFPVYFWGVPSIVKEFVESLQIGKGVYVFAIANCGGVVGAAFSQLENLLGTKGVKLSATYKIKMPENYQLLYSVPSDEEQKEKFNYEEEKVIEIAKNVTDKKIVKTNYVGKYIIKTVGNVMYRGFKPYDKDKNFWTDEKCNGCGTCLKVCAVNNITQLSHIILLGVACDFSILAAKKNEEHSLIWYN
jgi:flavodoxin/NAD-dependent dihydropyrimidine dehydrogenase PreA subunit